jgi:hypothetical protein
MRRWDLLCRSSEISLANFGDHGSSQKQVELVCLPRNDLSAA